PCSMISAHGSGCRLGKSDHLLAMEAGRGGGGQNGGGPQRDVDRLRTAAVHHAHRRLRSGCRPVLEPGGPPLPSESPSALRPGAQDRTFDPKVTRSSRRESIRSPSSAALRAAEPSIVSSRTLT